MVLTTSPRRRNHIAALLTLTLAVMLMSVVFLTTALASTALNPATLTVQIAPGADLTASSATWTITDITTDVVGWPITAAAGRSDEATQAQPASMTLTVRNPDGDYTPRNPRGAYWPDMRPGFPIQVYISSTATGAVNVFAGYVTGIKPATDAAGNNPTVTITAHGELHRLQQGEQPLLRSALYRAVSRSDPDGGTLEAYWPMEDGANSTRFASATTGVDPLEISQQGGVDLAADSTLAGSAPLPATTRNLQFNQAMYAEVDVSNLGLSLVPNGGAITVGFWARLSDLDATSSTSGSVQIKMFFAGGPVDQLWAGGYYDSGAGNDAWYVTDAGATHGFFTTSTTHDQNWRFLRVVVQNSSGSLRSRLWNNEVIVDDVTDASTSVGTLTKIRIGLGSDDPSLFVVAAGHLAVWDGAVEPADMSIDIISAGAGYAGETASDRIDRLCTEQGVPITINGTSTVAMGPQSTDTFTNLIRECEAADHGVLYDGLDFGLGYQCLSDRYNAAVDLALDVADGDVMPIPVPVEDTQRTRNDITVVRKSGSSTRSVAPSGDPYDPDTVGRYVDGPTVNVETDGVLQGHADWLRHLGTIDEDRYPTLSLNFRASPSICQAWLESSRIGARITVAGIPVTSGNPPDLIVEGYSVTVSQLEYTVELACSPASPYQVAVVDTSRVDAADSTLAASVTAGATTLSVASVSGLWNTSAGTFDLWVGGYRVECTAISGATSPQTFTVTGSTVTDDISSGATVRVWNPARVALEA